MCVCDKHSNYIHTRVYNATLLDNVAGNQKHVSLQQNIVTDNIHTYMYMYCDMQLNDWTNRFREPLNWFEINFYKRKSSSQ